MRPASFPASANVATERESAVPTLGNSAHFADFGVRSDRIGAFAGASFQRRSASAASSRDATTTRVAAFAAARAFAFYPGKNRILFLARVRAREPRRRTRSERGAAAPPWRRPGRESFFAKWLTSENHVISFRPTQTCCGKESSRIDRQLATP